MAKILSNTSTASSLTSVLTSFAVRAISSLVSGFRTAAEREAESLPARLRHDLGAIDVNPILHREPSHGGASDVSREMMRRHF